MASNNQYYDSNIYMQSKNLITKAAHMYYYEKLRQQEIAERLEISVPTVSRILKKAKEQGIVRFTIDDSYLECLEMETELRDRFGLKEVIVAPLPTDGSMPDKDELKKLVALEGARYLQRVVSDGDTLGVAWGETVWYTYNYLNPSQRLNMGFVTLHGAVDHEENKLDGSWLVPRIAKVFGGKSYTINCKGILNERTELVEALRDPRIRRVFEKFHQVTISISGVGMVYPEKDTILLRGGYIPADMVQALEQAGAVGDLGFRFFDQNGRECATDMRARVIGIPYETYRRIPNKVIVASGEKKAMAVRGLLNGGLVDTLIIDQGLARSVLKTI